MCSLLLMQDVQLHPANGHFAESRIPAACFAIELDQY